jgi:antitoxin MazE
MPVRVSRWGNSLGLRIPRDIASRAGLREGDHVEIEIEAKRIIISPAHPRYVLAKLLRGMTPEAMREAFDWGRIKVARSRSDARRHGTACGGRLVPTKETATQDHGVNRQCRAMIST